MWNFLWSCTLIPKTQPNSTMKALQRIRFKRTLTLSVTGISVVTLLVLLTGAGGGFPVKLNPFLTQLKEKTVQYTKHMPEDRVYVHFDKPFYKPGEDIWFAAYVRDAASMKKSDKSEILYVDLINPKGNVSQSHKLVAFNGMTKGDFHLDAELPGGMYKVKAYTKWQDNQKDAFVFEKEFQVQKVVLPNLKMKLDFDREAYGSGDQVTASLDLNTNANQPLSNYDFSYVASLDGTKLVQLNGSTDATGKATLKFNLPEGLKTNDGLVNVMIQYNGLTESISRSVPILLNTIKLSLFPEGGDLVEGLSSKVAFRALNEFDKPADIEGVVVDDRGSQVAQFSSYHMGMGSFNFEPLTGRTYSAKITKPAGVTENYPLPDAMPRGYVMNVRGNDSKELLVRLSSTEKEAVSLVAQSRGKILWASEVELTGPARDISIPVHQFPMGVTQVTLFDSKGIERCERLAFVNRDRQLNVDIKTDKERYLPREKVKMTLQVTDDRGMPMPANLSLSVVNDQLLSFADDKSGNILSKLLLEPDLKQKVEEPAFYFKKDEEKSLAALDHLMMTSGWRRFTWEQIIEQPLPSLANAGEKAQVMGQVLDAYTGQPVPHASITDTDAQIGLLADKNGRFQIDNFDLSRGTQLTVSADDYAVVNQPVTGYNQNTVIYLYNNNAAFGWGGGIEADDFAEVAEVEEFDMEGADMPMRAMDMPQKEMLMAGAPVQMNAVERRGNAGKKGKRPGARNKMFEAQNEPVEGFLAVAVEEKVAVQQNQDPAMIVVEGQKDKNNEVLMNLDGLEKEEEKKINDPKPDAATGANLILADAEIAGNANGLVMAGEVVDFRWQQMANADQNAIAAPVYYRSREFAAPVYKSTKSSPEQRTDFRSTLYWNPLVEVDRSGRAKLEFYASDEITSFRTVVEGIGRDGSVGHSEGLFFTQLPFSMSTRVPTEVATNDKLVVPVTLTNNTDAALSGSLHVIPPAGLTPLTTTGSSISIPAKQSKTVLLAYNVASQVAETAFEVAFASQGHTDAFKQPLKVVSQGFPVNLSFSGNELKGSYDFRMANVVPGSMSGTLTAYPNVVSDLVKGIESILREPYGCFEQTSTSSYPNALVMNYMLETDQVDPVIMKRARDLLDKGYKRLATFECSDNGYEWFGSNPPHEALTAYGLMQFNDYSEVYSGVDKTMVKRTADWLMKRRDGKGGFKKDAKALDSFGRADGKVTNAYIVYALAEAGFDEIDIEANAAYKEAISSKDPYQLALVACAMFELGEKDKAQKALTALMGTQSKDGSFTGKKHSITFSQGQSLKVETTSLAVLAMVKSGSPDGQKLQSAVEFITSARSGHGGFGSTQATIMALKSLVEYAKFAKRTDEAGTIEVYVDGRKVAEKSYEAGTSDPVAIEGLGAYLSEGTHNLEVKYKGCKEALPYSVALDYYTFLPNSSAECVVDLKTKLSETKVKMGETVRLSATLKNTTQDGQPMTMAIIGLPAGLSAQPWQLKELQEKKVVDFYEVVGNNIACYYRQMKPGETREINLDLKADIPGRYTAPASSAYLYYTAENKIWTALPEVEITN